MSNLNKARALLEAAHRDLKALTGMLDSEVFAEEIFGFHVQQAAEKALKAWLELLGEVFPYTHDLGVLLQKLENRGYEVTEFWDLLDFNLFAVQLRYDSLHGLDEPIDRQDAIEKVRDLYGVVDAAIKRNE
jgi:HEPN domain-containing protein